MVKFSVSLFLFAALGGSSPDNGVSAFSPQALIGQRHAPAHEQSLLFMSSTEETTASTGETTASLGEATDSAAEAKAKYEATLKSLRKELQGEKQKVSEEAAGRQVALSKAKQAIAQAEEAIAAQKLAEKKAAEGATQVEGSM